MEAMSISDRSISATTSSLILSASWILITPCYWCINRMAAMFKPTTCEQAFWLQSSYLWLRPLYFSTFIPFLIISIIFTSPFAVIGVIFWISGRFLKPNFYSIQSEMSKSRNLCLQNLSQEQFVLTTMNVRLLPELLMRFKNMGDTNERAKLIGSSLSELSCLNGSSSGFSGDVERDTCFNSMALSLNSLSTFHATSDMTSGVWTSLLMLPDNTSFSADNFLRVTNLSDKHMAYASRNSDGFFRYFDHERNCDLWTDGCSVSIHKPSQHCVTVVDETISGDNNFCSKAKECITRNKSDLSVVPNLNSLHIKNVSSSSCLMVSNDSRVSPVNCTHTSPGNGSHSSPVNGSHTSPVRSDNVFEKRDTSMNSSTTTKQNIKQSVSSYRSRDSYSLFSLHEDIFDFYLSTTLPNNTDFLCLQDIYDPGALRLLLHHIKQTYPYIVYDISQGGSSCGNISTNSGLLFASRFPIEFVLFKVFNESPQQFGIITNGLFMAMVRLKSPQPGTRGIVGFISIAHLDSSKDATVTRKNQLNQIQTWQSEFRDSHSQPTDIVAFDLLTGDFNFDNMSHKDEECWSHSLLSHYQDPCRICQGKDKPWTIGTELIREKMHSLEIQNPVAMRQTLSDVSRRGDFLESVKFKSSQTQETPVPSNGRRRSTFILYNLETANTDLYVDEYHFITSLANVSDRIPVAMKFHLQDRH